MTSITTLMFKKYRIYQNVYIHTVEWKNSKKYIQVCTSEIENECRKENDFN